MLYFLRNNISSRYRELRIYFKHHVMTRRNVQKQGWVFSLFSPDSDDRLSIKFPRFVIWSRSCDTRRVGLGQYCLIPKGSNDIIYRVQIPLNNTCNYMNDLFSVMIGMTNAVHQIDIKQVSSPYSNICTFKVISQGTPDGSEISLLWP